MVSDYATVKKGKIKVRLERATRARVTQYFYRLSVKKWLGARLRNDFESYWLTVVNRATRLVGALGRDVLRVKQCPLQPRVSLGRSS